MDDPGWVPSLQTLMRIQSKSIENPLWPSLGCERFREIGDDNGFVFRRIYTGIDEFDWKYSAEKSGNFSEIYREWVNRRVLFSDVEPDLQDLKRFDNVTIIDTSNDNPENYKVLHHSAVSQKARGTNEEGKTLGHNFRSGNYSEAIMTDYSLVKARQKPLFCDMVWFENNSTMGAFYKRVCLPFGYARIVTAVQMLREKITGEVEYAASISFFDE
jgi:hypothetical protein